MKNLWDDPRVQRGMRIQLDERRRQLADGAVSLGWKIGFGTPAMLTKLGIAGPLIGYMTSANRLDSGATAPLAGWAKPLAEEEIAVHMGENLGAGADRNCAARAIAALGPAIELADLTSPPDDPAAILAGNIYHRHVVLGPADTTRAGAKLDGLVGHVSRDGEAFARVEDLEANTGKLLDLVAHVAQTLSAFGEELREGEVVICGSVVPPIELAKSDREIGFRLDPEGQACSVRLA